MVDVAPPAQPKTIAETGYLAQARYGKANVRVFRIVREGIWHHVVEYNVTTLVEGAIETSYTKADNSVLVATDSIKNITNYLAKVSPHVLVPERFGLHLGVYLVSKYAHLSKAFVTIEKLRWSRIPVAAENPEAEKTKAHPHSFYRNGDDIRTVDVEVDGTAGKDKLVGRVKGGIKDLLVLKSTGSAFENFVVDEHTTLAPVDDRIFSTAIDCTYTFKDIPLPVPTGEKKLEWSLQSAGAGDVWDADVAADLAREITLNTFATDESASVQATLYKMARRILARDEYIASISYSLPNKHYIPVNMQHWNIDNLTPNKAEVFTPIAAPSGYISATVNRE